MKRRIYRYFQIAATVVFLVAITSSCTDFLSEIPGDKVTPEEHYKSRYDATSSVLGAYSILQDVVPDLVLLNELRADLLTETENYDPNIREIDRNDVSVDNKYVDPSGYYRIIVNINEVLANLDAIRNYDKQYDSLTYRMNVIDLVSLRSWVYFTLVRLYGEAAYIPDNMITFDESYQFNYYTKEQMIDTLLSQLDSTMTYPDLVLDEDYSESSTLRIYDRALRGELYLEKGDYTNAVKYLLNALGSADLDRYFIDLYDEETWENIFTYSYNQGYEVMSCVPFSYEDIQENPLSDIFYANRNYQVKPSSYIVNLFSTQKTRRNKLGDEFRGEGVSYIYYGTDSLLMVNKYSINSIEASGADIILYRAGDIHLLLAEALNRIGEHDIALDILNEGYNEYPGWKYNMGIRDRVYLKPRTVAGEGDITEEIEDMIMEERALELAFEGKRWFDLMRVASRRGESYLADRVAAKYDDPELAQEIREKLMDKSNWYLPFRK